MEKKFGRAAKQELIDNDVAPHTLELNKEYKFDHITCPAGEDRRQRLYVANKGGAIVYKCFNCGGSGHYRERESWSPITHNDDHSIMEAKVFVDRFLFDKQDKFSDEALLWLLNYEIDPEEYPDFFVQTSGSLNIAVMNGDKRMGFQRRFFNRETRYLTRIRPDCKMHYLIGKEHPNVVFVVEDLVSSYKVWSLGYSVIALLGTTLKGHWPSELADPSAVVVWLDNDTAGHKGAIELLRNLSAQFPNTTMVCDRQPKEVPYKELSVICGSFK